jgi:predicted hotdog family 3-hydroxylacyl-ACP dehydratase
VLDRAWITAHIPHQDKMSLLHEVVDWSQHAIVCHAISHTMEDNPLRAHGRLGVCAGIEYAAQAMAVHGALLADAQTAPRKGYLTSVRGVSFKVTRLDDLPQTLQICAKRVSGDSQLILYQFTVHHDGICLIDGRATVVLDAQQL